MPARNDIHSILIQGSGPIVIGQACEFDYSGTKAVRVLKEVGICVILAHNHPVTIMTDPGFADATCIEALKPNAILPAMGGRTLLNLAVALDKNGILERYDVELSGASEETIDIAEDRQRFHSTMQNLDLDIPRDGFACSSEQTNRILDRFGLRAIIRPASTLCDVGGSVVYNRDEFEERVKWGLSRSPIGEILIVEALIGWKEYELEVMRDLVDQCVVVCSIENMDPLGIHTGDSITVAPQQTLTDKEYQMMSDAVFTVIRALGVETGGSNIQFAFKNGRAYVLEVHPRASRTIPFVSMAIGINWIDIAIP